MSGVGGMLDAAAKLFPSDTHKSPGPNRNLNSTSNNSNPRLNGNSNSEKIFTIASV